MYFDKLIRLRYLLQHWLFLTHFLLSKILEELIISSLVKPILTMQDFVFFQSKIN